MHSYGGFEWESVVPDSTTFPQPHCLQVVEALSPVEASLLNAKLSALEACLEPGLTRLNWNSRGIDSFVATTTKAIHEFQGLHHSVKKNSAIVEKLVNGLAAAQLVADLPAGALALSCWCRRLMSACWMTHFSPGRLVLMQQATSRMGQVARGLSDKCTVLAVSDGHTLAD